MKKNYILLLFLFIEITLFAQQTYVPDDNFEQALIDLGYDDVLNDYVLTANINTITYLSLPSKSISDITGIKDFIGLTFLDVTYNNLSNLDLSFNIVLDRLRCGNNNLSSLDLSTNSELTSLTCNNNNLSSLNISFNIKLNFLTCPFNNLTSLDVSTNTSLSTLWCFSNNLTSLDVSYNSDLTRLYCYDNNLTSLDVSTNTSLTDLSCGNNILSNLDVSANTSLTDLSCTNNNLSSLNVSSNTLLTSLYCSDNNLTSLDVSSNILLTSLYCFDNNLTNFDLTSNTSLTDLRCSNNSIKDLNVSSSNNLAYFDCSDNELVSLNIKIGNKFKLRGSNFLATNNPNLTCINVDDAAFSTLNLKNIDRVVNFSEDCSGTHTNDTYIEDTNFEQSLIDLGYDTELDNYVTTAIITSISTLNISGKSIKSIKGIEYFTGLTSLDCSNNELSQINLENNVELEILNCSSNNLTSLVLDSNIELRWLDCNSNNLFELNIKNGNNSNFSFFSSFLNSDLVCIEVDNTSFSNENWFNISSQITFSENCGSYKKPGYTYIPDDNFEQALIQFGYDNSTDNYVLTENISGLTELNLYFFNISNLKGIEDFVSLTSLNCSVNNFTSLDLSSNTALTTLNCTNNKELTSLNISSNTLLTTLNCYNNSLIDLNVSSNTLLTSLSCSSNNLSNLDISANLLLNQLNCSTNYLNSLNINSNTLLTSLSCSSNNLTSLDIGANLLLNQLNSSVNYLSSIDISKNIDLIELNCSDNNLSSLYLKNGNNTFFIKFNAVNNPNLNCIEVDNAAYSTTNWTDIDSHTSFSEDCSATASVEKLEKESYSLYPNPFSDKIHIKSTTSIDAIVITTLQGKEILRTKEITEELDVSNLSSGMYLLKLIFGANIAVEKIIKE